MSKITRENTLSRVWQDIKSIFYEELRLKWEAKRKEKSK
jgi:hypothetical protein